MGNWPSWVTICSLYPIQVSRWPLLFFLLPTSHSLVKSSNISVWAIWLWRSKRVGSFTTFSPSFGRPRFRFGWFKAISSTLTFFTGFSRASRTKESLEICPLKSSGSSLFYQCLMYFSWQLSFGKFCLPPEKKLSSEESPWLSYKSKFAIEACHRQVDPIIATKWTYHISLWAENALAIATRSLGGLSYRRKWLGMCSYRRMTSKTVESQFLLNQKFP